MGGRSSSQFRYHPDGYAVFQGVVSLENSGGFASVRTTTNVLAGQEIQGYRMLLKGDGKHYKLNLRQDTAFDGVHYQAEFETISDQWVEIYLPLSAFMPRYRGQNVPDAPHLDCSQVCQIGLMIAGQQGSGSFCVAIRYIETTSINLQKQIVTFPLRQKCHSIPWSALVIAYLPFGSV